VLSIKSNTTSSTRKRKVSGGKAYGDDDDYVEVGTTRQSYFQSGTGYGGGRDDVHFTLSHDHWVLAK